MSVLDYVPLAGPIKNGDWLGAGADLATGGLYTGAKDAYHLGKKIYNSTQVSGPAGIAGATAHPERLVQDQTTGLYFDPSNGQVYSDSSGQVPVTNPNVAQQVASNYATGRAFLDQLGTFRQQQQQAFAGQTGLADSLRGTIAGAGPSVAQNQLIQGLGSISADQMSQAAGASGNNAALARMNAMNNTAKAETAYNQAQGLVRANEVAHAQDALANVLGAQANEGLGGYGTAGGLGATFAGLAEKGQATQQGMDAAAKAANAKANQQWITGLAKAGGDALSGGGVSAAGAATGGGAGVPSDPSFGGELGVPTSFSEDTGDVSGLKKRGLAYGLGG
jgi:hypothetical protein